MSKITGTPEVVTPTTTPTAEGNKPKKEEAASTFKTEGGTNTDQASFSKPKNEVGNVDEGAKLILQKLEEKGVESEKMESIKKVIEDNTLNYSIAYSTYQGSVNSAKAVTALLGLGGMTDDEAKEKIDGFDTKRSDAYAEMVTCQKNINEALSPYGLKFKMIPENIVNKELDNTTP